MNGLDGSLMQVFPTFFHVRENLHQSRE